MTAFGKDNEERLLGYVRRAQRHIDDGLSPTDAVVKVARDYSAPYDMLPLMAHAINIGRQTFQRETTAQGAGILEKTAEFPLADVAAIRAALFPARHETPGRAKLASVVSDDYNRPPAAPSRRLVKAASAVAPPVLSLAERPGAERINHWFHARRKHAALVQDLRLVEAGARDSAQRAVLAVEGWCKRASREDPRAPGLVERAATRRLGRGVTALFDDLAKRASFDRLPQSGLADQNAVRLVETAIGELRRLDDAVRSRKAAEERDPAELPDRPAAANPDPPRGLFGEPPSGAPVVVPKQAGIFSPVLSGAGAAMGAAMRPRDTSSLVGRMVDKLDDPAHADELRGIEARAVLNDLMANDEVVSGYDPADVADAYNELTQLSPSSAHRAALLRPLLRARLTSGGLAPFEAEQIANIEKTVRQTGQHFGARNDAQQPIGA